MHVRWLMAVAGVEEHAPRARAQNGWHGGILLIFAPNPRKVSSHQPLNGVLPSLPGLLWFLGPVFPAMNRLGYCRASAGLGWEKQKFRKQKAEMGRSRGGKARSVWCWFRGVGSVRVRKAGCKPALLKFLAPLPGCGVWANAGPGVSRGSTPGHFLATRRVGWQAGAAKDE
jgi:hypothetical protein